MNEDRWKLMREAAKLYGGLYAEAVAEIERQRAIVDKLPKTADGVAVVPGMTVFVLSPLGYLIETSVDPECYSDAVASSCMWYSTKQAAQAAGGADA